MTTQAQVRVSPLSIASIIISMTIAAIGSGIMATYVPFVLTQSGETWAARLAVPALAFGGLLGCVLAGPLIRRVGHARLFACSMSMVIIGAVLVAADLPAAWWILARAIYGAASNVNFIIAQSWLNHAASNEWRGRAMSFFYMAFVLALGGGAWLFGQVPADSNLAPLIVVFVTALSILPIGLTRLPNPPAPASVSVSVSVNVKMAWKISPVGLVGVLASGGLSMVVQGFTPIYATLNGVTQGEVALLMLVMQTGLLFIQYPLGIISDRLDRRVVLLFTCGLIVVACIAALDGVIHNLRASDDRFPRLRRGGGNSLFSCQCACQRPRRSRRFRAALVHPSGCMVDGCNDRAARHHLPCPDLRPADIHLCDHSRGNSLWPLYRLPSEGTWSGAGRRA